VPEGSPEPELAWKRSGLRLAAKGSFDGAYHMHAGQQNCSSRIPLWFKLVYSAFVAVVVPYYWITYTPWNFLYFCDVALLMTLVGIWAENSLLISLPSIGIVLAQMLWVVDFLGHLFGLQLTGMTNYMFDSHIPLFVRGMSSFHGWLPFVLLWLVWQLGYDRRAFRLQTIIGIALLLVCYFLGPKPPPSAEHPSWAVNINYVFGMDDKTPQTMMLPMLWLLLLMSVIVVVLYLPSHLLLRRFCPTPDAAKIRAGGR
jgi:hypothetical protein